MNDRPTPETDAVKFQIGDSNHFAVHVVHARRFERERDDLLDRLIALEHSIPVELARLERERDEARDTIADVLSALNPIHNEGPRLASLRVKEERDEARDAAEKAKAFKRVMKEDNAKLRRELDELNKRLIEVCQYGVVCTIEREDLRKDTAAERALADRLADALTACERWVNQPCDVKVESDKALMEWKEARNGPER